MGGYYGTAEQQRQQEKSDRLTPWIMQTPGACLTGRLMGSEDPDRLGWDIVQQHLDEDKAFSFRFMESGADETIKTFADRAGGVAYRWGGYTGDAAELRAATGVTLASALGGGFLLEQAQGAALTEMQVKLVEQGMAPLSTAVLGGQNCTALSLLIRDASGGIAAMGFAGMLQNRFSPLADYGWIGAIATDPAQRGKGLGKRITAELIRSALDDLGANRVMGFADADNLASAAMMQSCGMTPSDRASYVVSLTQKPFTR